jgi:ferrochelatase
LNPRFQGLRKFEHGRTLPLGVVLVNLGTPESPTPAALRRYLAEFLSDPRVVEIPRLVWKVILHGIILRVRPRKSARAYAMPACTDQGSPLRAVSQALTQKVQDALTRRAPDPVSVALAMRYGEPAIDPVLRQLQAQGVAHTCAARIGVTRRNTVVEGETHERHQHAEP